MAHAKHIALEDIAQRFKDGADIHQLRDAFNLGTKVLFRRLREANELELLSEEDMLRIVRDRTVNEFPENPELRLEAVLSSVNNELKQATLLVFGDYATGSDIVNVLKELTDVPLPNIATFTGYCTATFAPIGFLVQHVFDFKPSDRVATRRFSLSEAGKKYRAIAAYSLKYAVDNNISLYTLLGPAVSSGDHMPPYTRARMLELILAGVDTILGLAKELEIYPTAVTGHLDRMEELGIIAYISKNRIEGFNPYTWVKGKLPSEAQPVHLVRLTERVAEWLYEHRSGTAGQIATALSYGPSNVSRILAGLKEQGLADATYSFDKGSEVIPFDNYPLLDNYVKTVRGALSDGPALNDMKGILGSFLRDRELFRQYLEAGIKLYRSASPNLNEQSGDTRMSMLFSFILNFYEENGRGPRPIEASEALEWGVSTTSSHFRHLLGNGFVIKAKEGLGVRYDPVLR